MVFTFTWKDYNSCKVIRTLTLLGVRLQPSPWMGFGRIFVCSLGTIFVDLRRWVRRPERSWATHGASARSWSQNCKRKTSLISLLCTQGAYWWRSDGIGGPEKRWRDSRKKKWLKNWRDSGCRKWQGDFFTWGGAVSFWGTGPELRTVHEGCNSHSECKPVLPCRLWQGQKELLPRYHWIIFAKG